MIDPRSGAWIFEAKQLQLASILLIPMASSATSPQLTPPMGPRGPASNPPNDILPTLFGGGYGTYQAKPRNYLLSVALHFLVLACGLWIANYLAQNREAIKQQLSGVIDISPYILSPGTPSGGGGGGGDRAKMNAPKGELPKTARDQFTPPAVVVRNEAPKLPVVPTVVAPEIKIAAPVIGDPLAALAAPPSNGTGANSGIGSGEGQGIGSGRGPGVGPGWGGGAGGGPYRVGGGVSAPKILYQPDPEYSEEARKAKYQGTVILWVVVGPDGRVHDVRVARSLGLGLDEKAMEAVRAWKFDPARKDGQAVAVGVNIEVNFHLY